MQCPFCSQTHPDNARFCPTTGKALQAAEIQAPTCPSCNKPIQPNVSFCPFCGHVLDAISQTSTVATTRAKKETTAKDWTSMLYVALAIFGLIAIMAGGWLVWSGLRSRDTTSAANPTQVAQAPAETVAMVSAGATNQQDSAYESQATSQSPGAAPTETVDDTTNPPTLQPMPSIPSVPLPTLTEAPTTEPTSTPQPITSAPVEVQVNDKDNAEMVMVPAGEFVMGADPGSAYFWGAEAPEHRVSLDAIWIYRTEVTNAMYQACVQAKACPKPVRINHPISDEYGDEKFASYPVVLVSHKMATAYCKWAGGRLPTEAEWEKAARGADGQMFPWGNGHAEPNLANYGSSGPEAVGSYPAGASPYGVLDMAGNVLEWVFDAFQDDYYRISPDENPRGPASGERRVIRGGAYHNLDEALRAAARASLRSSDTNIDLGFRCAMDAK